MMDTVLQGIPGVIVYIDDILVSSKDNESHLRSLEEVFVRLEKHGFRLKQEKCAFLLSAVEFLGHWHSSSPRQSGSHDRGASPDQCHPTSIISGFAQLLWEIYPQSVHTLHPLNALLRPNIKWNWSPECAKAFQEAKDHLTSARVLTHYDPDLPIAMAADASAYGVGAVISHVFPDGSERPVAFASRTPHASKRNYSQLDKEALSLVYGVKEFHQYLYGRKFTLFTDHQPLTSILGPKKGIPSLAAARLQRWAVLLSAYDYVIRYKSTHSHGNADGLSRLPLPSETTSSDPDSASTFNIGQIQALPVTATAIQTATRRDPVLSRVFTYVRDGWPNQVEKELQPFSTRQLEISSEGGCLLWGLRVIVPKALQPATLKALHETHPGISRMKTDRRQVCLSNIGQTNYGISK